ncbi:MAG TPA: mismatch-specific DNA-glycosylase [Candidatus Tumulicola sp.]
MPNLAVVFVGINPSIYSVEHGHNFARPGNKFWPSFSRSRLSASARAGLGVDSLGVEHDRQLLRYGFGFTDVVGRPTAKAAEVRPREFASGVATLLRKLRAFEPRFACFHGVTGYRHVRDALVADSAPIELGLQPLQVGGTRVFLAPNPSGANAHYSREDQVRWYDALALLVAGSS